MAVQVGHAILSVWRVACDIAPDMARQYEDEAQMKIVLLAPNLATLERVQNKAAQRGIPAVLIMDAGRTVLSEPTITVLGLGPMTKTDCNALTRGLEMM
jgi:peptidyl-tRNA hydrolase